MNLKGLVAVAALACMPLVSQAMSYNVCRATSRHIDKVHTGIKQGKTTADAEIASAVSDPELNTDTKKLLVYMYRYAEKRVYMNSYDFSTSAFVACLEFEPQWYSY